MRIGYLVEKYREKLKQKDIKIKELQFDIDDLEKLYSQANELDIDLTYEIESLRSDNSDFQKVCENYEKELQKIKKDRDYWHKMYQEQKDIK